MGPDDTWTPEQQNAERAALRERVLESMGIIAVVLVVVALALTASGCAQILRCPDAKIDVLETESARYYVFDEPNWQRALATFRGLWEGSCSIEPPAPKGDRV